jgi:hypothetical protein
MFALCVDPIRCGLQEDIIAFPAYLEYLLSFALKETPLFSLSHLRVGVSEGEIKINHYKNNSAMVQIKKGA